MNSIDYKQKYLKYKNKYLELKALEISQKEVQTQIQTQTGGHMYASGQYLFLIPDDKKQLVDNELIVKDKIIPSLDKLTNELGNCTKFMRIGFTSTGNNKTIYANQSSWDVASREATKAKETIQPYAEKAWNATVQGAKAISDVTIQGAKAFGSVVSQGTNQMTKLITDDKTDGKTDKEKKSLETKDKTKDETNAELEETIRPEDLMSSTEETIRPEDLMNSSEKPPKVIEQTAQTAQTAQMGGDDTQCDKMPLTLPSDIKPLESLNDVNEENIKKIVKFINEKQGGEKNKIARAVVIEKKGTFGKVFVLGDYTITYSENTIQVSKK